MATSMRKVDFPKLETHGAPDSCFINTPIIPFSWDARLELGYERVKGRSVPVLRRHHGPLRVQKHLYPEGPEVCQHILLHPPGGVAGGDTLDIQAHVGSSAWAQLTNPGAAKWYRSDLPSRQTLRLSAESGATLEWLPQEAIFFAGCQAHLDTTIELAAGAKLITWDIIALGRPASGESFNKGCVYQRVRLRRDGRLLWSERMQLAGGGRLLESPVGLAGYSVLGTLLASGEIGSELLAACRALPVAEGQGGLTQLPDLIIARFLGREAEAARHWFTALWQELRPVLTGRPVYFPRIWNT